MAARKQGVLVGQGWIDQIPDLGESRRVTASAREALGAALPWTYIPH
jgi:hypothetical protein